MQDLAKYKFLHYNKHNIFKGDYKITYVEKLILFTKALHYVRLVEKQDHNSLTYANILERDFLNQIEKEDLLKEFNNFINGIMPNEE